jgi:uncharacterized membrane protein YgcG
MNHTTTLAVVAAIAVGLALLMVAATPLISTQAFAHRHYHPHHHYYYYRHHNNQHRYLFNNNLSTPRVVVGSTQTAGVQAADNSQHCVIGAGATAATCSNTLHNTQTQTTNSGSTGGGGSGGSGSSVSVGGTNATPIQAADNSQHCVIGAGATAATCSNTPVNNQAQNTNSGSTGSG